MVPSGYVSCCYLHMALWLRSNVCTCAHSCVCAYVCVCARVCVYVRVCANDEGLCVGVGVGVHDFMCGVWVYVHVRAFVMQHVSVCVSVGVYMCMCAHVCVHMCT